jgi:hypothetical protein
MNDAPTTNTDSAGPSILASLRAFVPERRATFLEALRIAELQAQRLLHRLGLDSGPISEELLTDLPRLTTERIAGMPTSGCSFWNGSSWVIQVSADEPATRQRFTLFHEYKHIIDHGRAERLYGEGDEARRRAEQAADYFAGCVLMPRPLVKRAWCRGLQTAAKLAAAFDVSPVAATVRLAQIGLTDPVPRCRTATLSTPPRRARSYRPYFRPLSPHRPRVEKVA